MSFLHTLSHKERRMLRNVVKTVHLKHFPKQYATDYEADKLIAVIGPETVEKLLKVAIDHKIDDR
jgi:hypothetical protein|tara:strand:- start:443 stop:637 length:195 start_codon:yes stop_codon:yes gene_type:complete